MKQKQTRTERHQSSQAPDKAVEDNQQTVHLQNPAEVQSEKVTQTLEHTPTLNKSFMQKHLSRQQH